MSASQQQIVSSLNQMSQSLSALADETNLAFRESKKCRQLPEEILARLYGTPAENSKSWIEMVAIPRNHEYLENSLFNGLEIIDAPCKIPLITSGSQTNRPTLLIDRYVPEFHDGFMRFGIRQPAHSMPSLMCNAPFNPVWIGQSQPKPRGGNTIWTRKTLRIQLEIRISGNFWYHFHEMAQLTDSRWLNFFQFKQSHSYDTKLVFAVSWDWSRKYPAFMIQQRGDVRHHRPAGGEPITNRITRDIPMILGEWQKWEITIAFDPTGSQSFTAVELDGRQVVKNESVNCFPLTTSPEGSFPDGVAVRGMYFGGYHSRSPTNPLSEPVSVDYRNMAISYETPTDNLTRVILPRGNYLKGREDHDYET